MKIQQAAKKAGVDERRFCDVVSKRFEVSCHSSIVLTFRISPKYHRSVIRISSEPRKSAIIVAYMLSG